MNKQIILKSYKNEDDRLLIAKILDKYEYAIFKNKISNSDFLDMRQSSLVLRLLQSIKCNNYLLFGGIEEVERKMCIFYPEKMEKYMVEKNYNNIMCVIEIILPSELKNKYTHRDYLGALMKIGIKREKVGDIIVYEEGADIIISEEILKYAITNLQSLTRFSKAQINIKDIGSIHKLEIKKQEMEIVVSSLRLDNIIAELAKTSRSKACELIEEGRVLINFEQEYKKTKLINIGNLITIRGKGRFEINQIVGTTKKENIILKANKFI